MKRVLIVLAVLGALLVALLAFAPRLFKEDLRKLTVSTIDQQIKGSFYLGEFGLSFLKQFPNATLDLEQVILVGEEKFSRDTLIQADRVSLLVSPFSLLGKNPSIRKVIVKNPKVHAIVLADGSANWDIAVESEEVAEESAESSDYQFNLDAYELQNATIHYEDATYPMDLWATGVNHSGNGAFTSVEYDLNTLTDAEELTVTYAGVTYLKQAIIDAKVLTHIRAEEDMLIQLRENEIQVNDFPLSVSGEVLYKPEEMDLDLVFASTDNATVSSLYSLIPGVYREGFEEVISEGELSFDGTVTGRYSESQFPGFTTDLTIVDGTIKYPQLPKDVSGIQLDLHLSNADGNLEETEIEIKSLEAKLGDNPLYAKMLIRGLEKVFLQGTVKANLDLGTLAQSLPLEGNELKGQFDIDASFDGVYDEGAETFPQVSANMSMEEGYVRSADYPEAELTDLTFHANLSNTDGKMENSRFDVPDFAFNLAGRPIQGSLIVDHFEDPHYQVAAKGGLDLEQLIKLYPVEGMTVKGALEIDQLQAEGYMSDVEAERYEKLPTSGKVRISNLYYAQADLAHPVSISRGEATFTPKRLEMEGVSGKAGGTDFEANGYVDNYLAYALGNSDKLKGVWAVKSQQVNANDWITESEIDGSTAVPDSSEVYEVFEVPEGIELLVQAQVGSLQYKDLTLSNVNGILEVVDQSVLMDQVTFNMLDGEVGMRGSYQTLPYQEPAFAFDLDVDQMEFTQATQYFDIVKQFAPVANFMEGFFNTNFSIQGNLNENMYPVLENITSAGLFEILEGKVANLPILNAISEKTRLKNINALGLKDVVGHFAIEEGNLIVEPFDFSYQGMNFTIGGKQNITGALDYSFSVDVPTGKAGDAVFTALSDLAGGEINQDTVELTLGLGGTFNSPQLSGVSTNAGKEFKDQVANVLKDKIQEKTGKTVDLGNDSTQVVEAIQDSLKKEANRQKEAVKDSIAAEMESKQGEIKDKIDKALEEKLGEETKDKLKDLKDKVDLPFLKKKKKN
ncbi:MAG: AsmA-like C-terminal region-containing protein [Bacteroidota bacterium]